MLLVRPLRMRAARRAARRSASTPPTVRSLARRAAGHLRRRPMFYDVTLICSTGVLLILTKVGITGAIIRQEARYDRPATDLKNAERRVAGYCVQPMRNEIRQVTRLICQRSISAALSIVDSRNSQVAAIISSMRKCSSFSGRRFYTLSEKYFVMNAFAKLYSVCVVKRQQNQQTMTRTIDQLVVRTLIWCLK